MSLITKMMAAQGTRYEVYTNPSQELQSDAAIRSTSTAKQDAYTEALKRSLMESQVSFLINPDPMMTTILNVFKLQKFNTVDG